MNKTHIKTVEDLEREEQRLIAHLATLKQTISSDIGDVKAGIKDKLNPVKKIKQTVRNLFVRDDKNGPAINFALNFVLDYIIRLFIPNRTNVFTKTIIPFITKNYVSHLVTDEQRQAVMKAVNGAIAKLDKLLRKARQKKHEDAYEEATGGPAFATSHTSFTTSNTSVDTNPMGL